jgi:hypothetical protein
MSHEDLSISETNNEFARSSKKCPVCGKSFIVPCSENYTYKVKDTQTKTTQYYSGYTHWMVAVREREAKVRQAEEAYFRRLRDKKNKENKRRRERKNGRTQDVQPAV